MWEGTTALTEDSSSPYANSTFRVTTAATGITPGSITETGTTTLTYGDANSMTTSPAKIDFTIIAKRQDGTEITISKQQSLSYSQAGATGAGGDAVDIVFVRAASQPATPTASSGTPTAPITWYTDVASVPASANPLWSSVGFKVSASANYTWDTPVRVEGASVAEVTVFTRGVPTSTPTGGTYTFSNPPVLVVPTSTGATWYTSIPSGTTAVYTSRAVVSTAAGNTSAVAITGWTTPVISFQNGADAVLSDLSNDNHTVPTDSSGSNGNFTGCATTMSVFLGSSNDSANWTYAVTKSTGVTCTEAITSRTQTVTAMTTDTGTVTIVASKAGFASQTQVFSISKAKSGVAYQINLSDNSVRKSAAGILSPTTLTLTASKLDISGVTAYTGRFKIYLNGSATATYTSAANEASKAYTVTATDTTIKCELYLADGTTTLVDTETVLVVADGANGSNGTRGSGEFYVVGSSWTDAAALAGVVAIYPAGVVYGDTVTISNNSNFVLTKYWNGSAWTAPGTVIDGNLLVTGSVKASSLQANTAAVSGSTMTGSGGVINAAGTFALGNTSGNISYNGTTMTLNGDVVATENINANAVTAMEASFSSLYWLPLTVDTSPQNSTATIDGAIGPVHNIITLPLALVSLSTRRIINFSCVCTIFDQAGAVNFYATDGVQSSPVVKFTTNNSLPIYAADAGGTRRISSSSLMSFTTAFTIPANNNRTISIMAYIETGRYDGTTNWKFTYQPKLTSLSLTSVTGKR